MARISTYPIDSSITGGDKWIGSDVNSLNATKNFTADGVAVFLNSANKIETQSLRYVYQDWQIGDVRKSGSISFEVPQATGTTPFAGVTAFKISQSQLDRASLDISAFYSSPLEGNYILISKTSSVIDWAIYQWDSTTKDAVEPTFYDIGLTLISSSGSLIDTNDYFISLLQIAPGGGGGGDKNFVFTQPVASPSATWIITHNLNKFCSIDITDENKNIIYGSVVYDSLNQITVTFKTTNSQPLPQSGFGDCN